MRHWSSLSNSKSTSVCNPQGQDGLALLEGKESISSGSGQRDSGSLVRRGWRVLPACICRFCSPRSPAWQMDYLLPEPLGKPDSVPPEYKSLEMHGSVTARDGGNQTGMPSVRKQRNPKFAGDQTLSRNHPTVASIHVADALLSTSPACCWTPHCNFVKEMPQPGPIYR